MPTPERFYTALKELKQTHSEEALNPSIKDQTAFGYGKACGIAMGLELAERLYDDQAAQEEAANESITRPAKR